jgi:soluble lytic murein transglycosylase
MSRRASILKIGVILHGDKLWFSELSTIMIIGVMLTVLFTATSLIFVNASVIDANDHTLLAIRTERTALSAMAERLRAQARIVDALRAVAGDRLSPLVVHDLAKLAYENSVTYGYDPLLVLAVIQVESVFMSDAIGRKKSLEPSGALGLMQLKFETAREIGGRIGCTLTSSDDLLKPDINCAIGLAYLTKLIQSFKSFKLGLLAYNHGPAAIQNSINENRPLSLSYYNKVLKSYFALKRTVDRNR